MLVTLDDNAIKPTRAHSTDAGLDLYATKAVVINPNDSVLIDTGVHVAIPHNHAGLLVSKSGLNINYGITSTGLIDEGYTGSIVVKLYNHTSNQYIINRGDKISQLVIIRVSYEDIEIVDRLQETERGNNGFGSTGK